MKLSEYIKKYGDCEVTDEIDKCIVKVPKTVYDLKDGDRYFFLMVSGIVQEGIWRNDDSNFDMERRIGNTFLTIEDAKFASERLKVIAELKKYAKEFSDEEWSNAKLPKYYISYSYGSGLGVCASWIVKNSKLYFESKEKAQEAIEWVGEDRIKKYYLGVKE